MASKTPNYSVKVVVISCENCGSPTSYSKSLCRPCSENIHMRTIRNQFYQAVGKTSYHQEIKRRRNKK